jgi:hypothetical protein
MEPQEFLVCFKKDRQCNVTQVKQVILLSPDKTSEVTCNVSTSFPSISFEDVSNMLVDHSKNVSNQMECMIQDGVAKSLKMLNISSDLLTTHANQHALSSSALHVPLENPQFGMLMNYMGHLSFMGHWAQARIVVSSHYRKMIHNHRPKTDELAIGADDEHILYLLVNQ